MGSTITFQRPDGQSVQGYLAEPANPMGAPAVVVIQEWWGLNDQIRGVAERFANAGFIALVPDLYRGQSTVEAEEAHHLMDGLNFGDAASQDVRGAVQYLKGRNPGHPTKVGITGYCMGGALTLLVVGAAPRLTRPWSGTAARRSSTSTLVRSRCRCRATSPHKTSSLPSGPLISWRPS